jgi:hypothetical protein
MFLSLAAQFWVKPPTAAKQLIYSLRPNYHDLPVSPNIKIVERATEKSLKSKTCSVGKNTSGICAGPGWLCTWGATSRSPWILLPTQQRWERTSAMLQETFADLTLPFAFLKTRLAFVATWQELSFFRLHQYGGAASFVEGCRWQPGRNRRMKLAAIIDRGTARTL